MNRMPVAALLPLLLLAACADRPLHADTRSFEWLAGCWRAERPDGSYDEMWLPPAPDGTVGIARRIRDGRTVTHEHLRIRLLPDATLAYIAHPSGQNETTFRMVGHQPGLLTFENPTHDFPNRIVYQYEDSNSLNARIEGQVDGEFRAVVFPLKRIACDEY